MALTSLWKFSNRLSTCKNLYDLVKIVCPRMFETVGTFFLFDGLFCLICHNAYSMVFVFPGALRHRNMNLYSPFCHIHT
jgi:hypothetical protein